MKKSSEKKRKYQVPDFILITFIILCLLSSCKVDPQIKRIDNLNGNKVSAFGHEGMGIFWRLPIDTYQSIEECLRFEADGTEMDVEMTSDSVLLAFHDDKLEGVSSCSGYVNDHTWLELKDCLFNSPISSGLHFITLDSLFNRISHPDKFIFTFDCKLYTHQQNEELFRNQYVNAVIRLAKKHQLENNLFVEFQDTSFLRLIQIKDPKLKLFIYPATFEEGLDKAEKLNLFGITISNRKISENQVKEAHRKGFRVTVWNTQTESDNREAVSKSVDFIQSDKINYLLTLHRSNN